MPPPSPGAVNPELIVAEALAHYGVGIAPDRARQLADEVTRMLAAVDRAAGALAFEDEPARFTRQLRELGR